VVANPDKLAHLPAAQDDRWGAGQE
jgi:RNA polymerase sigma-70 factor (ECF subfamily)